MTKGLKQKEELQNNFIQSIAHDLRAPIIAQERAISILNDELGEHELFEGLIKNNENYLKMINLIIEAYNDKPVLIQKIEFDLNKIINSVIKALKPITETKNIKIENNIEFNFIIWADFISMNRIIMNLVANSVENISNDKTIKIDARKNTQEF